MTSERAGAASSVALRRFHTTYSATTVLPLDVGALTRTPRDCSSLAIASRWKSSSANGNVAWYALISASTSRRRLPMTSYMQDFEVRPGDQSAVSMVVDEPQHLLAHLIDVFRLSADAGCADDGRLPEIEITDLGHGDVERRPDPRGQRPHDL